MVINFDKNIDSSITSIIVSGVEYELLNVITAGSMGWTIDNDSNIITFLGTTDVQVTFNSPTALKLYSDQFELATSTPYNPFVSGLQTDPHYDSPKTGSIQSHTYIDTDIEKELIGNN